MTAPQSVLVIRLDAIGDALALTPLLRALSERAIAVDLVMTERNATIFSSRAARAVHVAPFALRSSTRDNLHAIAQFGAELRRKNYDCVLVATEDPGGYRLAAAVGAPLRAGFANGWGKPFKTLWIRTHVNRLVYRSAGLSDDGRHECEVLWSLGQPWLGGTPSHDPTVLAPMILESPVAREGRVLLQATTRWERLGIAFEGVVELASRLAGREGFALIASADEDDYARRLSAAAKAPLELCRRTDEWKIRVARAVAILAPDSGTIHLAGMLGTSVVAVFPPMPQFDRQVARWRPWAAPYRVIRAEGSWPNFAAAALESLLART